MFLASRTDSAIDDELAHIPAGYDYVHNLDYRLNPEHPPLIKALAMLPILFLHPNFPTQNPAWTTEVNGEWDMGTQFLYKSGNDANEIIQLARIVPILFTILAIVFLYLLAKKMMGSWWALLPTFLFAFDPTVLAQGHYVTTDVGATFGVLFTTYFFLRYIESPTRKNLFWAGLAYGIAQITKFSTPFIGILFAFVLLVLWLRELFQQWNVTERSRRYKTFFMRGWYYLWRFIAIIGIGYILIVYPVYFLFTRNYPLSKQVSDTTVILTSFANGPTPAGQSCVGARCLADFDIWMAKNPVMRPYAEYLLGVLMVLQRTDGGNTIYFLGHVSNSGGWLYFPLLFLLKEPIPTLIIIFIALALAIIWAIKRWRSKQARGYLGEYFTEFCLASFIVLYLGYSLHSSLNLGIRYILPIFPFIYILAAVVWKKWIMQFNLFQGQGNFPNTNLLAFTESLRDIKLALTRSAVKYIVLILLLVWLALETLFATPYFLSYFNEFGGGVWNGYHYATDSNYDWGQDLLRLQSFTAAHPEINKIAVDYFGGGNPGYYLGSKEVDWSSSQGNPENDGIHWLAVSINTLEIATQPLAPGQTRNASNTYAWLTALRPSKPGMGNVPTPDYRVGTSLFIYKL
jgi:hypothetical protein